MRRTLFLVTIMLIVCSSLVFGQTRRIVLMEEVTNASCGYCATYNPRLQEFFSTHFGGVVSVRYHAWWPGGDPMYDENTIDNTARIQYYGINGVPNYLMDGVNYGVPGDPDAMVAQMTENMSVQSPVKIQVDANIDADSVKTTVTLIGLAPVTATDLYLRTAIIERHVVYQSPPGTTAETDFPDVMRKLLPDAMGIAIASIDSGDTLTYQFSYPAEAPWIWEDLAVVSWLQSDATKAVVQSSINLPTYIIETEGASASLLELDSSFEKEFWIHNDNPDPLNLRIQIREIYAPTDWSYSLVFGPFAHDSVDVALAPDDSLKFKLIIETGSTPESIKLAISSTNLDDPYSYGFTQGYFGLIAQGNILFVDDDGGEAYENNFYDAFDSAGVAYTSISEPDLLALAAVLDFSRFEHCFWNISWGFPAFVPGDIAFLTEFMDNGGNLFLAGQDIGWDVFDVSGNSNFPEAHDFYNNYLDANYLGDDSGIHSMEGIPGDPITDGISFDILNIYNRYPEDITSNSGASTLILKYPGSNMYGALRYENRAYKAIYLGIGLEQMSDQSAALQIVERSLDWFAQVSGDGPGSNPTVLILDLSQNSPNPFSIETAVHYGLPTASVVSLKIYDVQGREVRTLVNESQTAGRQSAVWDGRNTLGSRVSSGTYFCSLRVGKENLIRRMTILR